MIKIMENTVENNGSTINNGTSININIPQEGFKESFFDGTLGQVIGWGILGFLVTVLSVGLLSPWAFCMIYRWEAKHTVINGHRLHFNGTTWQLFGKWITWWLLTIVTLGIYSLWLNIKLKQWKIMHTRFAEQ